VKGEADTITDLIADACGAFLGASRYTAAPRVPTALEFGLETRG